MSSNSKNIAGHVLTYKLKNLHRLNKKLDLGRTISELGKSFLKKSDQKLKKTQINVKMPQVDKKPLERNGNLVETKKLELKSTMNG